MNLNGFSMADFQLAEVENGLGLKIAAEHKPSGAYMTVFVQPAPRKATSSLDCRAAWWGSAVKAKAPFKRDNIRLWENGPMALAEFFVKQYRGQRFNQKQVHGYLASTELWAEIHLSKADYVPADDKLFEAVLSSGHMLNDYSPNGMDFLHFGAFYFLRKDYTHAAIYYQRGLEREEQNPQPDPSVFKVLVDQFGMSYRSAGDLKRAKETFEHGVSKYPDYPFFYYNLARTYADMKDLDNVLANLEKAFERRNILSDERLPNPKTDSAFKPYLSENRFNQLITRLQI